jgi:hypothetical protein
LIRVAPEPPTPHTHTQAPNRMVVCENHMSHTMPAACPPPFSSPRPHAHTQRDTV